MEKSADAFRTISEVADDLTLPQHVLRFWETRFPQIRPLKRAGGRRYYRPADVVLLKTIRQLLYDDGYTIKGVQRLLKEQGPKALVALPSIESAAMDEDPVTEDEFLPDDAHQDGPGALSEPREGNDPRDTLMDAIASIEECLHILAAVREKS